MEWVRGETLGHGSFATVSLAKPKKQNTKIPKLMAVKSSKPCHSSSLINEKTVLEDLKDCPHIIQCFGSDTSYQNGEKTTNLLLEYASGGCLSDKIRNTKDKKLPEYLLKRYTRQILKGLFCVHGKGYVHCDIKPQNILLCSNGDIAKIADFGLAKKGGGNKEKITGTPIYMSPEMAFSGEQNFSADIWALGCLVSEMATGTPVWKFTEGSDLAHLMMRVGSGEEVPQVPKELSATGKDFVEKCFVRNPNERWTAQMLLDHPFIVDQDDDESFNVKLEECIFEDFSSSPKCPFDFPEWDEVTSFPSSEFILSTSTMERFRALAYDSVADWSVTDSWVSVR